MRCPTCTAENGSKAKFCRQCGAMVARQDAQALKTPIKRCDNCKIVAPSGAQYCTQCGESMMVTLIPGQVAAAAPQRSRRYIFAATALMSLTLAVVGVHVFGGGSVLPENPAATAGVSLGPTSTAGAQKPWLQALRGEMRQCESESIFAQPFCREKAKFKHCKGRWGSVEECPKVDIIEQL